MEILSILPTNLEHTTINLGKMFEHQKNYAYFSSGNNINKPIILSNQKSLNLSEKQEPSTSTMDNTITTSTAAPNNYSNLIKHFEIDEHASFWGLKKPLRDGKIIFSFEEKEQNDFIYENTHQNNEMNTNNNNNTTPPLHIINNITYFEKEYEIEIENGNEKNQNDAMTEGFDITALQKELKQETRSDSFQSLMDRFNINEYSSNHSNSRAALLPSSPLFSFSSSSAASSPRLAQRTPRPSPLRSLTPRSSSTFSDFPSRKFTTKDQRPIRPRRASLNRKSFTRHPNQSRHYISQNSSNNSYKNNHKQTKAPITIQFANHHYPSAPLRSKQQQNSFSRQRLPNSSGFYSRNKQLLIVPS